MATDMEREASALRRLLADRGIKLYRVVKRGKALVVECGPDGDGDPDVRLSMIAPRSWRLDLMRHNGRWEQTPFVGDMAELVDTAIGIGHLDDTAAVPWNRGDTSDPPH